MSSLVREMYFTNSFEILQLQFTKKIEKNEGKKRNYDIEETYISREKVNFLSTRIRLGRASLDDKG